MKDIPEGSLQPAGCKRCIGQCDVCADVWDVCHYRAVRPLPARVGAARAPQAQRRRASPCGDILTRLLATLTVL